MRINWLNIFYLLAFTVATINASISFAGSSTGLIYHGRIVKPDGSMINSGTVDFTVSIVNSNVPGCVLYAEAFNNVPMQDSLGSFELEIGNGTPIYVGGQTLDQVFRNSGTLTCQDSTPYVVGAAHDRSLRVTFNDGSGTNTLPLMAIKSAPWALQAQQITGYGINNLFKIGGLPGTASVFSLAQHDFLYNYSQYKDVDGTVCANGEILKMVGGQWTCATDDGGAGVVSSVTATAPLSVSGTTTVDVRINDGSTAGDTLRWTGAAWGIGHLGISDISGIVPISKGGTGITTAPTDGQILIGGSSGYAPAVISAGTGINIVNASGAITINANNVNPSSISFVGNANQVAIFSSGGTLTGENQLSPSRGGTGINPTPTSGGLLIGTGDGRYNFSTLTAGAGINITNASGAITIDATPTSLAGYISGSGTLNYVPKFTPNGSMIGNSPIIISSNNSFVGIGANNPQSLLHLNGDSSILWTYIGGSTYRNRLSTGWYGSASGDSYMSISLASAAGSAETEVLNMRDNGAVNFGSSMSILSGGNIGIGTNNPASKLEINGNVKITSGASLLISDATNAITQGFKAAPVAASAAILWTLPGTTGDANQVLKTDGAGNLSWGNPGVSSGITGAGTSRYLAMFDGPTSIVSSPIYAASTGHVGFGTPSPIFPVHIVSGANSAIYLGTNAANSGNHQIGFGFHTVNSVAASIAGVATGGNGRGYLEFRVAGGTDATNATTSDTVLRLNSTSVDVLQPLNLANDTFSFGVSHNAGTKALKFSRSENKAAIFSVPQGGFGRADLRFATSDAMVGTAVTETDASMRLSPQGGLSIGTIYNAIEPGAGNVIISGAVGVGISSPTQKMDVAGVIRAGNDTSTSGSTILVGPYSNGSLTTFGTGASSGGPVIGYAVTPKPAGVNAFVSSTGVAAYRNAITMMGDEGIKFWNAGLQTVAIGSDITMTESMRISNSGYVGIGTTSPSSPLTVSGASGMISVIRVQGNNSDSRIRLENMTAVSTANTATIDLATMTTSQARTTAQLTGFHSDTTDATRTSGFQITTTENGVAQVPFLISGSKVGIGTTPITERLEVNGNIKATELILSSDKTLKKNIQPLHGSLQKILQLRGVEYQWRSEEFPEKNFDQRRHIGFIAQEVKQVYPELVYGDEGRMGVHYPALVAPLTEAIREQQEMISGIDAQCKMSAAQMNNRVQHLERDVASLKETVKTQNELIQDLSRRLDALEKKK